MKPLSKALVVATLAALIGLANSVRAQNSVSYWATGEDGITASPKLRQFLNERKKASSPSATASAKVASVGYRATGEDGVTASPRLRQFLSEKKTVASDSSVAAVASVGYRATGEDGIAASPKHRQYLDEHRKAFQIAPLK